MSTLSIGKPTTLYETIIFRRMLRLCLIFLLSSLAALTSAFAPAYQSARGSCPTRAVPGSIFEDPGGWFQHKMEVMQDKREVELYHILFKNDSNHYNPDGYLAEARNRANSVKASIESNEAGCNVEAFAEAAREHSDDPSSKKRGGRLGKFKRGVLDVNVDDAAFNGDVGAVIGPVQSIYGVHLLWVMDKVEVLN